jgi:hypothetical protein
VTSEQQYTDLKFVTALHVSFYSAIIRFVEIRGELLCLPSHCDRCFRIYDVLKWSQRGCSFYATYIVFFWYACCLWSVQCDVIFRLHIFCCCLWCIISISCYIVFDLLTVQCWSQCVCVLYVCTV